MNWRNLLTPFLRMYWQIFKPQTYGVKALILHPDGSRRVFIVRHSYGDSSLWNLPGGGYNPERENPLQAVVREVKEELNTFLVVERELFIYKTGGEGKTDTVTVFIGTVLDISFKTSGEVSNYRWEESSVILKNEKGDMARVLRHSLRHLDSK